MNKEISDTRKIAERYLDKAEFEPWNCNARDVQELACMVCDLDLILEAAEKKYGDLLTQSIDHGHAMLGNVLKLCLEKAEKKG